MIGRLEHLEARDRDVWVRLVDSLAEQGIEQAAVALFDLRRTDLAAWARLKGSLELGARKVSPVQKLLLDHLIELSRLPSLEALAGHIEDVPLHLRRAFWRETP